MIKNRIPEIKDENRISLDTLIEQVKLGEPSKIIITPTDRLARFLRNYEHEKNKGETRPGHNILDYKTWIRIIWEEYLGLQDGRLLLSRNQEQALWTNVIEELAEERSLINRFDTAQKLSQARKLLYQFQCFDKAIETEGLDDNDRDFLRLIKQGQQGQQGQHENDIFPSETLKDDFYANPEKDKDRFFFLDAHYLYQKKCRENKWIDTAELPDIIIEAIKAGKQIGIKDLPTGENREVIFAGFSNTEPQTKALIEALNNADTKAYFAEITSAKEGAFSLIADINSEPDNPVSPYLSPEDEFKASAAWAKEKLSEPCGSNGENEKIYAILAPNLGEISDDLTAVLDKYLCPEIILPENRLKERPYNVSYSKPLASYYAAAQALLALELVFKGLPVKDAGHFMLSPCFVPFARKESPNNRNNSAGSQELSPEEIQIILDEQAQTVKKHLDERSAIYTKLRSTLVPHVYIDDIVKSVNSIKKGDTNKYTLAQEFAASLDTLYDELPKTADAAGADATGTDNIKKAKLKLSQWPEIFFTILNKLHFMEGLQSSGTKQLINKLMEAINGLKSLEIVCPEDYTGAQALGFLRSALIQKQFQPRIKAKRLQIMGFMEAQGQKFEEARIINFQDRAWPANAAPLPYLPYTLQEHFGMPNSSPKANLEFAEHITESIKKVAPLGSISWCRSNGSSDKLEEYRLSPLWESLTGGKTISGNSVSDVVISSLNTWPEDINTNKNSELVSRFNESSTLADDELPVQPEELQTDGTFKGGTKVIETWAQCPFKAFAELRLGAKAIEDIEQYPGAREKGNLAHNIMQFFWTGTFDKIHSPNLEARINKAIAENSPLMDGWKDDPKKGHEGGCRTQAELKKLCGDQPVIYSDGTLNEDNNLVKIVEICTKLFIDDLHDKRPDISSTFLELEKERVQKFICEFLFFETKRRPFKVIAAEEEQDIDISLPADLPAENDGTEDSCATSAIAPTCTFNSLIIHAKIDRIDEYDDGSGYCIIDYKTGKAETNNWAGVNDTNSGAIRLKSPQVPIYANFGRQSKTVAAAAFAKLSAGLQDGERLAGVGSIDDPETETGTKGIKSIRTIHTDGGKIKDYLQSKYTSDAPDSKKSSKEEKALWSHKQWKVLLTLWKEAISSIAKQFCQGNAFVSPLETGWTGTCNYCKLSSLCRKLTELDDDDKPEDLATSSD